MEINAKITILVGWEHTTIEVFDENSKITFLRIKLTPEQLSSALSRLAYTECESTVVTDLEHVGKKRETQKIILEISDRYKYENPSSWNELTEFVQSQLEDGWFVSRYFGSKDSFFSDGGKDFVNTLAFRYI